MRVDIKPKLLRWASERSGLSVDTLAKSFPKFEAWTSGQAKPTLKQLERFAKTTRTPIGYLFLPSPPDVRIPIPDFRKVSDRTGRKASPDLLETIYICQQRQEWYREYARSAGEEPFPFIGSAHLTDDVMKSAAVIRDALGFDLEARKEMSTWSDALRHFIEKVDAIGILVMSSGVVLNNNTRRLDPQEFRGFALADPLAPLVFINGADTKAAQMFTIAHELAHLWLGQTGVSDAEASGAPKDEVEQWCNNVAAELLVPLSALQVEYRPKSELHDEVKRLARLFKVSTLVVLRRIHDTGGLSRKRFWEEYNAELERLQSIARSSGGGNFYATQVSRGGERFVRALLVSTLEGQTLYRDASRMLGISKPETLQELGRNLGIV